MNAVNDLMYDVRHRIEDENYNPTKLIRVMNREYWRLNRERKAVVQTVSLAAGTFSDVIKSYAIPSNFVKVLLIVPGTTSKYEITFIPSERWNPNQYLNQDVYTMLAGYFVFGNVNADTALTLYLQTIGKILVHAEDSEIGNPAPAGGYLSTTYTNTPEWPEDLHELLVIETAMSLKPEYPMIKRDQEKREDLLAELSKYGRQREQAVTQQLVGGLGDYQRHRDPDYVNGQWVTRE